MSEWDVVDHGRCPNGFGRESTWRYSRRAVSINIPFSSTLLFTFVKQFTTNQHASHFRGTGTNFIQLGIA